MQLTCTGEQMMKTWISAELCDFSLINIWTLRKKVSDVAVQKFGKFVRASVYPYGRSFWIKTTSRKNLVFHLSLGLRGENTLIRHNLVCSLLTRLRFLNLELHFEIFSNNFAISHQFQDFSMNFSLFSLQFSAQSSEMHFTCGDEHSMKIWVSAGKCNSFS